MMKRRVTEFSVVIYNNEGQVEVAFNKAKKVPKAYDSFVACIEIACLSAIQKVMSGIEREKKDGKDETVVGEQRSDADNSSDKA